MPRSVLAAFVNSLLAWPLGHRSRPSIGTGSNHKVPVPHWGDAECFTAAKAEAYKQLKWIEGQLAQEFTEPALRRMHEREKWFRTNRQFLPGALRQYWLSIRSDLQMMLFGEKTGNRAPDVMQLLSVRVQKKLALALRLIEADQVSRPVRRH
jgi:hypothetical protein